MIAMQTHSSPLKTRFFPALVAAAAASLVPSLAHAVSSAELYSNTSYQYGRYEARIQFTAGDGIVSTFFLWKVGSEQMGTFWNELDFEKIRAECYLDTNALYGAPELNHTQGYDGSADICGEFHTYTFEWTPDYVAWFVDDDEIRRETGEAAAAFRDNASEGMRFHFNLWPGDATFGGNFDPNSLPAHQYINWVQYSSYENGQFQLQWREDFDSDSMPAGWSAANWQSPKQLSTHSPANVTFSQGYAVLSLTADNATGPAGAMPNDTTDEDPPEPNGGSGGEGGAMNGGAGGAMDGGAGGAMDGGAGGSAGDGGTPGADDPLAPVAGAGGAPDANGGAGPDSVAGAAGNSQSVGGATGGQPAPGDTPPPLDSTGAAPADEGCACQTVGAGGAHLPAWLTLLASAWLARARRRTLKVKSSGG